MRYDEERNEVYEDSGYVSTTGYCSHCGQPCRSVPVDTGIGRYEYCGRTYTDRCIEMLSPCCNEEVIDELETDDVV